MTGTIAARATGKLGYRPALDGLRAVSVIAVLLYHIDLDWIPGGFLGVEVFFVVSGFLITSSAGGGAPSQRGDVAADLLGSDGHGVCFPRCTCSCSWCRRSMLVFYKDAAGRLGGDVLAALFYVSNWWQIYLNESYFAQAGRPPVLRHLWSLAVEEQFYIVFPVVFIWLLARAGRNRTRNVLIVGRDRLIGLDGRVVCAVHRSVAGVLRHRHAPVGSASGCGSRCGVGPMALEALSFQGRGPALDLIGGLAVLALIWFFTRVNEFDPFIYRGGFLMLDVVCIVLIAVLVHPSARLSKVFAVPPLVWIGVRSYSIYLWHWPIFIFTRPELDVPLTGWPLFFLRVGLTLFAAEMSFRYVEQPIRNGALSRGRDRLA